MILVHVRKSWPDVLAGQRSAADVTLGTWAQISDEAASEYGDVVLGIYRGEVVSAFDIDGWTRSGEGRIKFSGQPSIRWAYLIGGSNPGRPWVRGAARPVQYLNTSVLLHRNVKPEVNEDGNLRAVVGGFTLTVDVDSTATVLCPSGSRVTVISRSARDGGDEPVQWKAAQVVSHSARTDSL